VKNSFSESFFLEETANCRVLLPFSFPFLAQQSQAATHEKLFRVTNLAEQIKSDEEVMLGWNM
jgi:hypothetical protein